MEPMQSIDEKQQIEPNVVMDHVPPELDNHIIDHNHAVPTPLASRSASFDTDNQMKPDGNNAHASEHIQHNNTGSTEPIGGILTKYKQSNLLFKVRKSYAGNSPHSPNSLNATKVMSFEDEPENEVDINEETNTAVDNMNVYNLTVSPPPSTRNLNASANRLFPSNSPREERRSSGMRDFTYKPRHRVTRSNELEHDTIKPMGRARAMSDGHTLHTTDVRRVDSYTAETTEFANFEPYAKRNSDIDIATIEAMEQTKTNYNDKHIPPYLDYIAILVSGSITWIFYQYYIGFYNWNGEIKEFNDGSPSDAWHKKYLSLAIVYVLFIWTNMGFNPFYFSYFRKFKIDIKTKEGIAKICFILSFLTYCVVMTSLCITRYDDYSVRLARLTVLYVLIPVMITNVIISGYLLQRQPSIFIACHCVAWLISMLIFYFVFAGYDGHSLHLTYYFLVSIVSFCAYILIAVAIKASIYIQETDLNATAPKGISLRQTDSKRISGQSAASVESENGYIQDVDLMTKDKFKGKPIDCCCNACEIELLRFFRIQSILSALTFWSFWGVASISERAEYDTITELFFVIACCWWNPMFYSFTKRASKSIKKYMMTSYFIFGAIMGIIQCSVFLLYWMIKIKYGNGTNGLRIGSDLVLHEQNVRFATFLLAFVVSFIFYFPATGYLFFHRPVAFGLSHLFFATMAVFIPLAITDIADRNLLQIGDAQFGVKFITDEFDRDINNKKMTVIVLYMVIFAMFLSLSGFSCTYFRFKKVLVESQALVTGYKQFEYRVEYPMTLTMFITLMFAFGDFITDFLFAFIELGLKPWIRVTSIGLFIIQILLQAFSLQSSILKVRGQLSAKNSKHQLQYFSEWLYTKIGKCGTIIVYPFCWFVYYIVLLIVSLVIGLSKTIAVRQVQQWWLSLIVVNYKRIANKKIKEHTQNQKKVQERIQNIGARRLDHTKAESKQLYIEKSGDVDDYLQFYAHYDDDRYHLNDIHDAYWAELDKMYVKRSDGQQQKFDDDEDESENDEDIEEANTTIARQTSNGEAEEDVENNYNTENEEEDEEYDANYDPRFDDDNISMRIQKVTRKKQNRIRAQTNSVNKGGKKKKKKKKKKRKKKKKESFVDRVWLGWDAKKDDLGIIFKIYLFIDKYTPRWMRSLYINANVYNTYFLTELIVESLPQCILIITNAYLKNDWSPIAIASITFSGIMVIYNVTKIVYYVGVMGKDMRSVVL